MYIIKNAVRSIFRSKGRNILIGIIALVIAVSSCVALSIRESANKEQAEGLKTLNVTAKIEVDREKIMKEAQENNSGNGRPDMSSMREAMQGLSLTELQKYEKASSVKDFYYTMTVSINGNSKLKAIDLSGTSDTSSSSTSSTSNSNGQAQERPQGEAGMARGLFGSRGDFSLIGVSSDTALTDFTSGASSVTSGVMFTEGTTKKECIISEELASYNSLKVGSTITFKNPNASSETYKFKVVGIYKTTSTESTGEENFSASGNASNRIYTSYTALEKVTANSKKVATTSTDSTTGEETSTEMTGTVSGTYTFADATAFSTFQTEVTTLGLSDNYKATSQDVESYNQSLVPLNNLSNMALWFFLVLLGIGGIILIVLNIFNIRERKYEIGVLTAMGMKKGKVAMQFVIELFLVTFMAVVIGTAAGAVVSVPISNNLLASQASATQSASANQENNFGRGGAMMIRGGPDATANVDYLTEIDSATNIMVVLQLLGVAILLTIVSSAVAAAFVMRYEPLKILSNRD